MKPILSIKPGLPRSAQRGGFFLGVLVGLLTGLALALGVALYVTKVPVPFIDKVPQHSPEADAAETERNKQWDPNSALGGYKAPPAASEAAPGAQTGATLPGDGAAASAAQGHIRDPAAILGDKPIAADSSSAPTGIAAEAPITYFVQAGAYLRNEDAEQQRVRLAILGLEARISEHEQRGRTIFRVRVGPYEQQEEADAARARLEAAGLEAALVRVQR